MIILNSQKDNTNFKNIFKNYQNSYYFSNIECPFCKSNNLIKWGFYFRNVYYIVDNNILFDVIKVQRVKCKVCSSTHALIPNFIIPYKQFLLDVILSAIFDPDIFDKYKFSISTLSNWHNQFNSVFLPYLNTTFLNLKNIFYNTSNIYEKFYLVNKKILMMTHKGIFNMSYF